MCDNIQFGEGKIVIWADICIFGSTNLLIFGNEAQMAVRYADDILRRIVALYSAELFLMDDNSRRHFTHLGEQFDF